MIRPKMPAAWHTSKHHRALKYSDTTFAAYDPLVDRLHVIEKIEEVFLSLRCYDERFHCSRILIERVLAEAIKSGLVQYNGLKPLGTYEQRKALEEVMRTRYLIVVDSGEPEGEGSLGLLLKATGYPMARAMLASTIYAHWFVSYHGQPSPDLVLHGKWRCLKLLWIPDLEHIHFNSIRQQPFRTP